jgi:hypothetical protein
MRASSQPNFDWLPARLVTRRVVSNKENACIDELITSAQRYRQLLQAAS